MIRILFFAFSLSACAQVLELGVGGGVSRLSNAGLGKIDPNSTQPDDFSLKGGYRIVMRLTTNSDGFTGHEFGYAYNRTQLVQHAASGATSEQGMAIHQGFYNYLLYATREGSRIRPFLRGLRRRRAAAARSSASITAAA
jgi:hypothetical protein